MTRTLLPSEFISTDASSFGFVAGEGDTPADKSKVVPTVERAENAFATAAQGAKADSALQAAAIGDTVQSHSDNLDGWSEKSSAWVVNVIDKGAKGDGSTDDSTAFQDAIDALPSNGGKIIIPPLAYVLNTEPDGGAKSIYWDIHPGATFSGSGTGSGKFPSMVTNSGQIAVGPYIVSRSSEPSPDNGGIAAFNVEMLAPDNYDGYSVGIYAGAKGKAAYATADVWAANFLVEQDEGALGGYIALELDANRYASGGALLGLLINGVGTYDPTRGWEVKYISDGIYWEEGGRISKATLGLNIQGRSDGSGRGVLIEPDNSPLSGMDNGTALGLKQFANGDKTLHLQRATDSAPGGTLIDAVNAANSQTLFYVDASGNLNTVGIVAADCLRVTGAALSSPTGEVCFGNETSETASAGTIAIPDAYGFLHIYIGGTRYGIPYVGT